MRKLMLGGNFLITGAGSLNYLENIKDKTVFIVTGSKSMLENGVIGKMEETLHNNECQVKVYSGIRKNPDEDSILAAMKVMNDFCPQVLIAIGGGSPMDAAKIMAIFYEYPQLTFEDLRAGKIPQNRNMLKFIAIPTTSGTASEVTRASVVTFRRDNIKIGLKSDAFVPDVAILDPTLTMTMPKKIVAETGMDAMTHAVEAYVSTAANQITDACAEKAISMISEWLRPAVANGENIEARDAMAYAQYLAGMAFNNASLGYVHAMAHQLGGFYNLPHGVCNAILLPHVCEFNLIACPDRYAKIAQLMGVNTDGLTTTEAAFAAIDAIRELSASIGIPSGLAELGVKAEDHAVMTSNAQKDACMLTNPRKATDAQVIAIFESAM